MVLVRGDNYRFPPLTGRLVDTVKKKYLRAVENISESQQYFRDLTAAATPRQVAEWEEQIADAEQERFFKPEAMDVMEPKVPKRMYNIPNCLITIDTGRSANLNSTEGIPAWKPSPRDRW